MKIAIFHCEEIPSLFLLKNAADRVGFKPYVFHYKDICLFINKGKIDLRAKGISLNGFSAVFCRGFWNYQNEVSLLIKFCRFNNIQIFDSVLAERQFISKMYDLVSFKTAGLPVPKTVFLDGKNKNDGKVLAAQLKFPMVAKEDRSRKGIDVFAIRNQKELNTFLSQSATAAKTWNSNIYQFQEFIPADYDVRVIVIGGRVIGAIERRSADPKEFRHNISLGGVATAIPVTKEMVKMALKAARVLKYEFAGVDLIRNKKTEETYVLEVNRSPGFEGFMQATGIDVPFELMRFFLKKCVDRQ